MPPIAKANTATRAAYMDCLVRRRQQIQPRPMPTAGTNQRFAAPSMAISSAENARPPDRANGKRKPTRIENAPTKTKPRPSRGSAKKVTRVTGFAELACNSSIESSVSSCSGHSPRSSNPRPQNGQNKSFGSRGSGISRYRPPCVPMQIVLPKERKCRSGD